MSTSEYIDAAFAALSDPTRRHMIERLLHGEATVSELAEPHDMSLPAALKHVNKLVDAGIVTRRKEGRTVLCALNPEPMDAAQTWLQTHLDFWNSRLDALEAFLDAQATTEHASDASPQKATAPKSPPDKETDR